MSEDNSADGQEKSHDPSPGRLDKARRDGDVPQSKEVNAAAGYVGLFAAIALAAGDSAIALSESLTRLHREPAILAELVFADGGDFIWSLTLTLFAAAGVFLLLPALGVVISLIAQRAFAFSPDKIKPKLSRLSLPANAKKKFGPDGIAEFLKSAAKLVIIFGVFSVIFIAKFDALPGEAYRPAASLLHAIWTEALVFVGLIVLFSAAVATLDLPWTLHQYTKRMKMTHQELKQESKENEGDPALKQSRRRKAEAIAMNRMMQDVPKADVIIVNPTHYAVALAWRRGDHRAPVCVAKGVDEIAARIRETAAISGVPIRRDPPTARAIYAAVEIGAEIKREHFAAVAAAIHFADKIRSRARNHEVRP